MQEEKSTPEANLIGRVQLSELQVRHAIVDYLLKNEKFKELVVGKQTFVIPRWQTSKWDDPDALVHVEVAEYIGEPPADAEGHRFVSAEESE